MRWAAARLPGAHGYWPAQAVANFALGRVAAIDTGVAMMHGLAAQCRDQWDVAKSGQARRDAAQMPLIVNMGDAAGTVTGTDAAAGRRGPSTRMCDQIVSGADETGDVLVIFGATLIVWAVVDDWIEVPGLWTVPHTVAGKVLVGGPSNAGALFVDWARSLLHGAAAPPLSRRRAAVPASTGTTRARRPRAAANPDRVPVWTPYLRGERAPYQRHAPCAPALHGLDMTHDADALERAAYEASGFVIRHMLDRAGIKARRIVASGGGTHVVPLDAGHGRRLGSPGRHGGVPEGSALGAAYMARWRPASSRRSTGPERWATCGLPGGARRRWAGAARTALRALSRASGDPTDPETGPVRVWACAGALCHAGDRR